MRLSKSLCQTFLSIILMLSVLSIPAICQDSVAQPLDVPYYMQDNCGWCAYASLSMLLSYYGTDAKPREVASYFNAACADGLELEEIFNERMQDYLNSLGYLGITKFKTWNLLFYGNTPSEFETYIKTALGSGKPVWLSIRDQNHAVVIVGANDEGIFVNDPSGDLIRYVRGMDAAVPSGWVAEYLTWDEFHSVWHYYLNVFDPEFYTIYFDALPDLPESPLAVELDASFFVHSKPRAADVIAQWNGRMIHGFEFSPTNLGDIPREPNSDYGVNLYSSDTAQIGMRISNASSQSRTIDCRMFADEVDSEGQFVKTVSQNDFIRTSLSLPAHTSQMFQVWGGGVANLLGTNDLTIAEIGFEDDGNPSTVQYLRLTIVLYDSGEEVNRDYMILPINDPDTATISGHALILNKTGRGTISSQPEGLTCGLDCSLESYTFPDGQSVILTPSAEPGSQFLGWSGDCNGIGACEVVLSENRSVIANFESVSAPDAPYNLQANTVSSSRINITWSAASPTAEGFIIERRREDEPSWLKIYTAHSYDRSFSSGALNAGTTYYYRVCAFNAVGNSGYSNDAGATTFSDAPAAPTALTATARSESSIQLSWTDNSTNEDGFVIERRKEGVVGWTLAGYAGWNSTSYVDWSVSASTTYYYRVRAHNTVSYSSYSNEASVLTCVAPSKPFLDSPSSEQDLPTELDLIWDFTIGAGSYDLYFGSALPLPTTPYQTGIPQNPDGDSISVHISGLEGGKIYYWQVVAHAECNPDLVTASNVAFFTTIGAPGPVTLVKPSDQANNIPTGVVLDWENAPSTGSVQYDLYFGTTNPPPFYEAMQVLTQKLMTGLSPQTVYYWQVVAKSYADPSLTSQSAIWSFTTGTGSSATVTLGAQKDAGLRSGIYSDVNYGGVLGGTGTDYLFFVGNSGYFFPSGQKEDAPLRGVVQFDLSSIPAGVQVNSATLSLRLGGYYPSLTEAKQLYFEPLTNAWEETSITWSNAPGANAGYSTPGNFPYPAANPVQNDLTAMVQAWVNGSIPNHGLRISLPSMEASPGSSIYFYQRERDAQGSYAAQLSVTYAVPCSNPLPPVLSAPASGATGLGASVLLEWESVAGSSNYRVYFDTTNPPTTSFLATESQYTVGGLSAGNTYYWRVESLADCDPTRTAASEIRWLRTSDCLPIGAPVLSLPEPGATGQGKNVTFEWAAAAGASHYQVYLSKSNPPSALVGEVADPGFAYAVDPDQIYYWMIRAVAGCNPDYRSDSIVGSFRSASAPTADAGTDKIVEIGSNAVLGNTPAAYGGTPPYVYAWSIMPQQGAALDSNTEANPTLTAALPGIYSAWLTVTDAKGYQSAASYATVTIPEPVEPERGTLQFTSADYSQSEYGYSTRVYVSRTGGSYGAAGVSYSTSDGSASAGSDYSAGSGTLAWGDGDAETKSFDILVLDDVDYEGDETFTVTLTDASGASLGSPITATVTITEDDPQPPAGTVQVSQSFVVVNENDGNARVYVTRAGGSYGAATVSYSTANGTATSPSDYTAASGTLNWADGDAKSKYFDIPILDDAAYEGTEYFYVTLSGPSGASLGSPATASIYIMDSQPTLQFMSSAYSVSENGGSVRITVARGGASYPAASVVYSTANGTATAGTDYTSTTGTLSWSEGDSGDKYFDVPILFSPGIEGNETFTATLSDATGAYLPPSVTTTITIVEQIADRVWFPRGPTEGIHTFAIAIDPAATQTVYAGTMAGVYRSTDSGSNWYRLNCDLNDARSLAIDPHATKTIYAGGDGIYKSTDGGQNWLPIRSGLPESGIEVRSLAIDPVETQTIYAGTDYDGLYKSTDGGANWIEIGTELDARDLAIDPSNPQVIYAATYEGVFKSTDAGGNWTAINNGITNTDPPWLNVYALAIDPANPQTIYAGNWNGGVFKSTNGGDSWSEMNSGLTSIRVYDVAVDPVNTQTIYAAAPGAGILRSTNGAGSWTEMDSSLADTSTYVVAIDPNTRSAYAGTEDGVFRNLSTSNRWFSVNQGLTYTIVKSIAIHPAFPQTVYAATFRLLSYGEGGIYRSTDGGAHWTGLTLPESFDSANALAVDPGAAQTVYAGTSVGLFKTTDGGNNWIRKGADLPSSSFLSLYIDPSAAQTVYAGTAGSGIFKTADGGENWIAVNTGLTNFNIPALLVDPVSTQTIYAGSSTAGVFKSTNGGGDWSAVNNGLTNKAVLSLAIDSGSTQALYVGTSSGVFKSTDGGGNWSAINAGFRGSVSVYSLAFDSVGTPTIYAGTSAGVYISTDHGANWTEMNRGALSNYVYSLALVPGANRGVFAGTRSGVSKLLPRPIWDVEADARTDIAVRRPSSGVWYVRPSASPNSYTSTSWGVATDIPVPGDYDGDGRSDVAVWRPGTGVWYVRISSSPGKYTASSWGVATDIPVPGDYDGDGVTDLAVWRPDTGVWYVKSSVPAGGYTATKWGMAGDIPVPGDYDGDGKTDIAVRRPGTGIWYIRHSGTPGFYTSSQWGVNSDIAVPGDFDADGMTDTAVWRPGTGVWYIRPSGSPGSYTAMQWGSNGDKPVPGDYDGDGTTDMAVWRPANGSWYIKSSVFPGYYTTSQWGVPADDPISSQIKVSPPTP